ncbi:ATP-dependent Zn protease, partial [Deinobacterium chartae]|nr:ATP-dependent Zn protease [Deinobacterium chartae]
MTKGGWLVGALTAALLCTAALAQGYGVSDLLRDLKAGQVEQLYLDSTGRADVHFKESAGIRRGPVSVVVPTSSSFLETVRASGVELQVREERRNALSMLSQLLPLLLVGVLIYFVWRTMRGGAGAGGNSGVGSFGKSRAHVLSEGSIKLTFQDVAGCDEAKNDLA